MIFWRWRWSALLSKTFFPNFELFSGRWSLSDMFFDILDTRKDILILKSPSTKRVPRSAPRGHLTFPKQDKGSVSQLHLLFQARIVHGLFRKHSTMHGIATAKVFAAPMQLHMVRSFLLTLQ